MEVNLTGSHYFGTAMKNSDYDYFLFDSPKTRQDLEEMGFVCDYEMIVAECDLRAVYKKDNIQIQLRREPEVFKQIQELMKKYEFGILLRNKKFARAIWMFAWDCIYLGRKTYDNATRNVG